MMKHLRPVNAGHNLLPDLGFHQMPFWELVIVDLMAILLVQIFVRICTLGDKKQSGIMTQLGDQVQTTLTIFKDCCCQSVHPMPGDGWLQALGASQATFPHVLEALQFWCAVNLRFVMVLNAFGTSRLLLWRIEIFLGLHFPFRFDGLLLGF
jgi:hypothetical protein